MLFCTSVQFRLYLENTATERGFVFHLFLAVELSLITWKASYWFWVFWYPERETGALRTGDVPERVFKDLTRLKEFRWQKLGQDKSICSFIVLHSTSNYYLGIS